MTPDSNPPSGPPSVRLLVRKLERVRLGVARTGSAAVFCPGQCRSMGVEICRVCPRLSAITEEAIVCTPAPAPVAPAEALDDGPTGIDACVGDAMGYAALLVDAAVPAASLSEPSDTSGHFVAVVVDEEARSLGLVDFAAAPELEECSVEELARQVPPVREAAPLAHAIDRMVHERARALPVVNDDGEVVGVLTDLDALRWVARREPPGR